MCKTQGKLLCAAFAVLIKKKLLLLMMENFKILENILIGVNASNNIIKLYNHFRKVVYELVSVSNLLK